MIPGKSSLKIHQKVIAILGVCRSGTTAMLIAFAKAGYQTYYQPFKHKLRYDIIGEIAPDWEIPEIEPFIFKETIGPYYEAEIFNPAKIIYSNWKDSHNILFMIRNPLDTWKSWEKKFSGAKFSIFEKAYKKQMEILLFLQEHNMKFIVVDFSNSYGREKFIFDYLSLYFNLPKSSDFYNWEKAKNPLPINQPIKEPLPFLKAFKGSDSSGNPILDISKRDFFIFPKNNTQLINSSKWRDLNEIYLNLQKLTI